MPRGSTFSCPRTARSWRVVAVPAVAVALSGLALTGFGGRALGRASHPAGLSAAAAAKVQARAAAAPTVVASGIAYPFELGLDAHGGLWVASATIGQTPSQGLWYVASPGHKAEQVKGFVGATALAFEGSHLYVAAVTKPGVGEVSAYSGFNGSGFAQHQLLLKNLPTGSHTPGLVVGPGGRLFLGLGALEDNSGTPGRILSFSAAGGPPVIVAKGVRTASGLAFWGKHLILTDNGPDGVADSPDLLLSFQPGPHTVDFGFPACYGQGGPACAHSPKPLVAFPSHSTPEGVAVKGDTAYVAIFGSSTGTKPVPPGIDRVDLHTGRVSVFWRASKGDAPVGLAIGPDGDLYVTELVSGDVVRFSLP